MTPPSILRSTALALATASLATAAAAETAGKRIAFVSCPILRNNTVPCWLGQDRGELYYLGPQGDLQADFYPPQFGHKMLVEAEIADGSRVCGGIALKNVTASVLPELDATCNVILPTAGYPEPPNHRGPGPSGVKGGQEEERPRRGPPEAPKPPFAVMEFTASFNADSDRKWRPASQALTQAAAYARATNAAKVEITGYRAAIRLSDGTDYVEQEAIAEARARTAEEAVRLLGLPASTEVVVKWRTKPVGGSGTAADAAARKAVVKITPGAARTSAD